MRYITWKDVVARYPSAASDPSANNANNFDQAFGNGAEAAVDAALAVRYVVPVATTPTLTPEAVRDVTIDAAYWRMAWMKLDDKKEVILRESIADRLSALASGSATLVTSAGAAAAGLTRVWGTHQGYPNVTGMDDVVAWDVSSTEQSDLETLRDV